MGRGGGGQGNYIQSEVKKFLQYFYEIFTKGDSFELTKLYEQTFPKLTESFFKTQPWPEVEELLSFLPDDNSLFFIIYKELYFRHIYARVQGGPSIEQRYVPQAFCSNDGFGKGNSRLLKKKNREIAPLISLLNFPVKLFTTKSISRPWPSGGTYHEKTSKMQIKAH